MGGSTLEIAGVGFLARVGDYECKFDGVGAGGLPAPVLTTAATATNTTHMVTPYTLHPTPYTLHTT